mgnify:FL=1
MSIITLTNDSFSRHVLTQPGPVFVDFYAGWCGPCQAFAPILEDFAMAHPEVRVCKADVDALPEKAAEYSVQSIPTLLVFRDGAVVNRATGVLTARQLAALV